MAMKMSVYFGPYIRIEPFEEEKEVRYLTCIHRECKQYAVDKGIRTETNQFCSGCGKELQVRTYPKKTRSYFNRSGFGDEYENIITVLDNSNYGQEFEYLVRVNDWDQSPNDHLWLSEYYGVRSEPCTLGVLAAEEMRRTFVAATENLMYDLRTHGYKPEIQFGFLGSFD